MSSQNEWIAKLERANYAASLATASVTPGMDVTMRDDAIITFMELFPIPDLNHACLLRTSPEGIQALVEDVIDQFRSKGMPPTVFVSPACSPADLAVYLEQLGFTRQEETESWMVFENLLAFEPPEVFSAVEVKPVGLGEAQAFARVFMEAFGMPVDFAPLMAQVIEPSLSLPGVHHYLSTYQREPIGTCSVVCHEGFGILGSAGVLPTHRRRGAATSLVTRAITKAQEHGVDTLMLQTTSGTPLERLLSISGFRRVFTRSCYVLS